LIHVIASATVKAQQYSMSRPHPNRREMQMLEVPKPILKEAASSAGTRGKVVGKTRRPTTARILASVIALAVAIGAGVSAWEIFLRPIEVQVAAVERDVPVQVFGLGTVEARVTSRIGFKVSGVLIDLRADVGNFVAKGAILARLDDREQSAQVARTNATVQLADANLQRAAASVEKAQANYANAKSINERRQMLLKGNSTSIEAAQTAQAAQDAALADVNLAQSDVLVAKANIGDAIAQQQLQSTILDFYTLAVDLRRFR